MRINWLSNAPWARTGYGNQTNLFVPRLQGLGHQMSITAFYGLEGGILQWGAIPIYPRGHHPYGADVMSAHAQHFKADIVISLIDAWVIEPQMLIGGVRWVPWFPIDHLTVPDAVLQSVRVAWDRIVYSKFAERVMNSAGLDCSYVPHGVDTKAFAPTDRADERERLGWPADKFIVGMVAANKGNPSRKCFHENVAAFAQLKKKHKDVMLYLHTVPGEETSGVNILKILESLGLQHGLIGRCKPEEVDVLFNDQYSALIGLGDEYMNAVYNAMDVHLLVSMGEGFGIPIVEAQAAGAPVIVGDWTAMGELCFSGWKVPQSEASLFWTPLNAYQLIPRVEAIAEQLEAAYQAKDIQDYRDRARQGALAYDVDKVADAYWRPVLEKLQERIDAEVKHNSNWVTATNSVSIITPWLNASELITTYERSVEGAQVIIVDNGSTSEHAKQIELMVKRLGGVYIHNETNLGFSTANNQGLAAATGEVIVFMNNDVECQRGFVEMVKRDVQPGALYGPSLLTKHGYDYIEGWCIAGRRTTWDLLHGWEEDYYEGLYWEDNDLCWRAHKAGIRLIRTTWPVEHNGNHTAKMTPGAFEHASENEQRFLKRIREEPVYA